MKLDVFKNAITSQVGRQVLQTQKNAPTLLFVGGIVGVVATTVLASRATLKLGDILDEGLEAREKIADTSDENRRAKAKITINTGFKVAKIYAPSVIVGVASISALTGSHVTLTRRNAAVMAAYSALDKGFKEYRARVVDELGEEKDLEFRHGSDIRREIVSDSDGNAKTIEHKVAPPGVPSIYARFFDETSSSWSRQADYNRVFLSSQQNWMNDLLRSRGHVFLNEVYDRLGLSRTPAGAVVGWILSKEGDNFIDFGIFNKNSPEARAFVNGLEGSILLDFNVDGVIWDKI